MKDIEIDIREPETVVLKKEVYKFNYHPSIHVSKYTQDDIDIAIILARKERKG